ncbi:MAG: peptidylprolyl isomerase [Planctomycetota bacterium]
MLIAGGCTSQAGPRLSPVSDASAPAVDRAAFVSGEVVSSETLWPLVAERAGAAALEALALDRTVAEAADRAGISVSEADVAYERRVLEETLARAGLADRVSRGRAVEQARARRGWGPRWFDALLERNARLRRLTADRVPQPAEVDVRRLYDTVHGPRRIVRVVVTARERLAVDLRRRAQLAFDRGVRSGDLDAGLRAARIEMIDAAVEHSSDVSSARGGLLDPMTPHDPQYPDAFRAAVFATPSGALTPIIALDEGFAFAFVEDIRPGDGVAFEEARPALVEQLRLDAEQRAIGAYLNELRGRMRIEPLDPSLQWSWANRPR